MVCARRATFGAFFCAKQRNRRWGSAAARWRILLKFQRVKFDAIAVKRTNQISLSGDRAVLLHAEQGHYQAACREHNDEYILSQPGLMMRRHRNLCCHVLSECAKARRVARLTLRLLFRLEREC